MSVANLTRYDIFFEAAVDGLAVIESPNGMFVKFEEAIEADKNSLQQLKAKIAIIADSVEDYTTTGADAGTIACIVRDLRQLSAV